MQYHDYYGTLGVDKAVKQNEIQRAYRKLARTYHPDINKDPAAETKFKEIGEAYEVLKDPKKRSHYDRYGSAWKSAQTGGARPAGWDDARFDFGQGSGGGFNFDDSSSGFSSFFDMLFGAGGRGPQAGVPRAHKGVNHESSFRIPLEEAAAGGKRQITVTDPSSGTRSTLQVTIPKGVRAGQRIRLAERGGAGSFGGPAGDLLLRIEIEPHPRLRPDGADLATYLDVSPTTTAGRGTF